MHHRIAALTRERDHLRERVESRDRCEAATQARAGSAIMLNESLVEELAQARTRAETAEALVEALGKIAHVPVEEKGDYEALTRYMRRVARAALAELQRRLECADYPEIPGPCDTHPIRDWEGDKT